MAKITRMPQELRQADNLVVFDDFDWYISPHRWTSVLTDSGTATIGVGTSALALACSDGTVADNDEAYVGTTNAVFKPQAGQPFYAEGYVQFTEANTDDANVAFGLASSVGANLIVDDGAGLRTSGGVIALYKVDGETVWRFVTRNGTAVTTSQSTTTAGGSSYQRLSIEVLDVIGQVATIVPLVDGLHLRDATNPQQIIRHKLDLTSIAAMSLFAGAKNGGSNMETLNVDYLCGVTRK